MHELPLVFFTVLVQTAVAVFILAWISLCFNQISRARNQFANIIAMSLMTIGFMIGMLHMGQPQRAFNIIYGIGRSAMSNESILSGLFFGLGMLTILFKLINKWHNLSKIIHCAAAIVGLIFLWSITRVYNIETIVTWATQYTGLYLFLTSLIGGGLLVATLGMPKLGSICFIIGALISLAMKSSYISFLQSVAPKLTAEQSSLWACQSLLLTIALVLVGINLGRITISSYNKTWKSSTLSAVLLMFCTCLAILAELSGRIAFYNLWVISM